MAPCGALLIAVELMGAGEADSLKQLNPEKLRDWMESQNLSKKSAITLR